MKDLTIARRLLGVEVTTELGGLCFDEMEEGKGRGFDGTFRLSTLTVVVIFLPVAFPVLVDFYFVLLCRVFGYLCNLRLWLPIDLQFPSLVGALLSRAWSMFISGVLRYFPIFGPQTCAIPSMRQLFLPMVKAYDRTIA
ncbi:hypothetical protein TIFTF001_003227 [Ficus carica]|uniref:Uncharacterized protein n=1 Tax=Ficus carica TaxID=3494 RepID=A0AA87ZAE4_FICCA|nr:hypothetical protein TIFTF001_003227 [Ficus carica]